jgi:hypothetical protein
MDDQQKKQIMIAGVLGAVLLGVLVYQFLLAGDPPPGSAEVSGDTGKAAAAGAPKPAAATRPAAGAAASVNLLETTEINIEELTQSVEVQPMDYRSVKIARNPMSPLVGVVNLTEGEIDYGPPEGEDTTRPPRVREVAGIIWDEVNPVAIIDNMVVHEGYVFADGVVVQGIEPTRVLLKIGESIRPLEMKEF